jgi:uncharacterized protein (DUF488 family)
MEIYTIGFTKRSAEEFFGALRGAAIEQVIDVRLRNDSTLSGFTRKRDLPFFLKELVGAEYRHEPLLAPTADMLDVYRKRRIAWPEYESRFRMLLKDRDVSRSLDSRIFSARSVLLCSESTPAKCHRRLAAEYLAQSWPGTEVIHL